MKPGDKVKCKPSIHKHIIEKNWREEMHECAHTTMTVARIYPSTVVDVKENKFSWPIKYLEVVTEEKFIEPGDRLWIEVEVTSTDEEFVYFEHVSGGSDYIRYEYIYDLEFEDE